MRVILTVIAGPHKGLEFAFDKHDTFLVGRSQHAHFQLPAKDKFFSRIHFMMEVNPPQCRLIDMGSHNGTYVNGERVLSVDLKADDQIRAGHTILRVKVIMDDNAETISFRQAEIGTALPVVPGYTLVRELGRGAMGATYLGHRALSPEEMLAIKVVQPSLQGSPTQIDEFLRAARLLTQLEHPHVVRLREVGECPSGFYFASDYVAGVNANELIQRDGRLPTKRAVRIANQLLQALQYAHAKQVIHRDIKPANVLITQVEAKDVVYLTDFGLARVYQATPFSGLSLTADVLNVASFMPPEVLFSYKEISPVADQYSVAAVLYYLLTGQTALEMPKQDSRRFSTLLRRQYVPLGERRSDVPVKLAEVIHKGLSRLPSQRFASIAAFRQALVRATQAQG